MPPRRSPTRQARLPLDDPDARLAERYANYRVLRKAYLSATALASYSYCSVKPFVERVASALGLDAETAAMRAGVAAHAEVQDALSAAAVPSPLTLREARESGAFLFGVEVALKDERRMLRGIADIVFTSGGAGYVVELKDAAAPPQEDAAWRARVRYEHGLQLQFYALLARRELGATPRLALGYLRGAPRDAVLDGLAQSHDPERALLALVDASVALEANGETLERVNRTIRDFRRSERRLALPQPDHADPRRCRACRVRTWCPRRLDAPGRFEPLDARRLDAA